MPVNPSPLGALPARFRRQRILVIGCGDVALRVVGQASLGVRWLALTSTPGRCATLRGAGITPLLGNLDTPASLHRLAGLAHRVLYLAPPPGQGSTDPRAVSFSRALRRATGVQQLVYGSTSGVYGDCAGVWVDEHRIPAPHTPRAQRRVHAEQVLRSAGRNSHAGVSVLRIPGIYAPDRPGGTPLARLQQGTPVLRSQDDVYTNHIHADDLARACWRALWRGAPQRTYHVCDDTELKMGDYFDLAAALYGLPSPPRVARHALVDKVSLGLSPARLSFMSESRRLRNLRMKNELGLRLRYPDVRSGLFSAAPPW